MFYKKIVFIVVMIFCATLIAQTKNNEWQLGVGVGLTKFSTEDASYIGDKHQIQIPRLNATKPISDHTAIDLAFSVNTFDTSFVSNSASYFSLDASYRYFVDVADTFFPYAFIGASLTDSEFEIAPAINAGLGATIWVNEILGFNGQAYYKVPFNADNMRSHIQITVGMVFALNLFDLFHTGNKASNGFCR